MSIYESLARGLNEAIEYERGRVSLRSNTLTISEPEEFNAKDIKTIRAMTGLSQAVFAEAMGVSKKTVEAWEAGINTPSGAAKRLLALVEENPRFFENEGIITFEESAAREEAVIVTARNEQTDGSVNWINSFFLLNWRPQPVGGTVYGTSC